MHSVMFLSSLAISS